jgi:alpha-tubulin suppressor-like RCC1 family protein
MIKIKGINAGGNHSSFIDEIGRLFMCGSGEQGQLGTGQIGNELSPYFI